MISTDRLPCCPAAYSADGTGYFDLDVEDESRGLTYRARVTYIWEPYDARAQVNGHAGMIKVKVLYAEDCDCESVPVTDEMHDRAEMLSEPRLCDLIWENEPEYVGPRSKRWKGARN